MNNVKIREDGTIVVMNAILSYPHLFKAWARNPNEKAKFSARFLLPKDTHAECINIIKQQCIKILKENNKGEKIPADKYFLRDGDLTGKPEDEGRYYIAASEDTRPNVIDRDKSPLTEEDDKMYPGAIVNVLIRPWWQNNNYGKRINANLLMVQFVAKGERIAGAARPDVDDVFDEISDEFGGDDIDF